MGKKWKTEGSLEGWATPILREKIQPISLFFTPLPPSLPPPKKNQDFFHIPPISFYQNSP